MKLKPTAVKAQRTTIAISQEIGLEGYLMPNSRYTLNPTSLTNAMKKRRRALYEFLGSKSPLAQSCQGFSLDEIESIAVDGGGPHTKLQSNVESRAESHR